MSSKNTGSRTTVTVDDSIMTGLEEFCELYDISGKSNAVETLLAIVEATGIPLDKHDTTDQTRELTLSNIDNVRGFVISNNDSQLRIIGTDASNTVAITNTSTPSSSIQPLPRTNITEGTVICPACGTELFTYSLSDSLPGLESGVFKSLDVTCHECGSHRPHYTLFVGQSGSSASTDVLMNLMEAHFGFLLVTESQTQQTFNERVTACKSLADDGGVQWLPSPDKWIGYTVKTLNYPEINTEMYYNFLQNYIVYLINEQDDVQILDCFVEEAPDKQDTVDFQITVETRGSEANPVFNTLQTYTAHWEDYELITEELDEKSFADNTYIVTLNKL